MKRSIFYPAICFIVLLSSCQRYLVPVWFKPETDNSKASEASTEQALVRVENIKYNNSFLIFDVIAENHSDDTLAVEPQDMYYCVNPNPYSNKSTDRSGTDSNVFDRHYALMEFEVASSIRKQIKTQKTNNVILGILCAGLIVYDATQDAKDNREMYWTGSKVRQVNNRKAAVFTGLATADAISKVNVANAQKESEDLYYLSGEILPATTLQPGEQVRGKVFFKYLPGRFYRLTLPFGGLNYIFDFRKAESRDRQKLVVQQ